MGSFLQFPVDEEHPMVRQQRFEIDTRGHGHMQDVTPYVARIVAASGIRTGFAHVFNVGSTGAIGTGLPTHGKKTPDPIAPQATAGCAISLLLADCWSPRKER